MAQTSDAGTGGYAGMPSGQSTQSGILQRLYAQADDLAQQIEQAKVDAAKRDPDGSLAPEAYTAQKNLPALQSQYRSLLGTIAVQERSDTKVDSTSPATRMVGKTLYQWNDATQNWEPAVSGGSTAAGSSVSTSTTEPFILTRMPDGTLKQETNPNYRPPGSNLAPRPAAGTTRMNTVSANGRQYTVREVADGFGGWGLDPDYQPQVLIDKETDPNATAYQQAQTANLQATTAKTLQSMLPAAQKALQDYYDSIGTVQGLMEQGKMSPAEASTYMDAFKSNLMAGAQGTTPWQMKQDEQANDLARAQEGRSILNQRLSSGSGLAQSLIGMVNGIGSHILAKPGQTFHFDPFAMASQFTDQMGGGPETSALAKTLLGQIAPGAARPAPVPAAMPTGLDPVRAAIINMLANQPDLARAPRVTPVQGVTTQVEPVVTQVEPVITPRQ